MVKTAKELFVVFKVMTEYRKNEWEHLHQTLVDQKTTANKAFEAWRKYLEAKPKYGIRFSNGGTISEPPILAFHLVRLGYSDMVLYAQYRYLTQLLDVNSAIEFRIKRTDRRKRQLAELMKEQTTNLIIDIAMANPKGLYDAFAFKHRNELVHLMFQIQRNDEDTSAWRDLDIRVLMFQRTSNRWDYISCVDDIEKYSKVYLPGTLNSENKSKLPSATATKVLHYAQAQIKSGKQVKTELAVHDLHMSKSTFTDAKRELIERKLWPSE